MAKSSSTLDNKKQATPSQKRLQKQQQQQQSNRNAPNSSEAATTSSNRTRDLDAKVGELNDKNDSCKEKLSARLIEFSQKAAEIKSDIGEALERQAKWVQDGEQASDGGVRELRERLVELTTANIDGGEESKEFGGEAKVETQTVGRPEASTGTSGEPAAEASTGPKQPVAEIERAPPGLSDQASSLMRITASPAESGPKQETESKAAQKESQPIKTNWFEPLTARLDPKSKFVTLKTSLERNFKGSSELIDVVCHKLVSLSHQIEQLKLQNEHQQREISKLRLIKERLGDLCRELQKSNNQIRIESLDLIHSEQHKAKEQADKIQTTLAGVMKLFDENQQRNSSLRQENFDLQNKLKMLLKHCENWEQCVETAIKQRDIENRLIKTELARLTLARTEEQERFIKEKQQLLKAIETMRQHQSRVEDKEAKLRSDLSSYASKYDQCQDMIQNGLGAFQLESKRMLSQIERSRQDYVTLLGKYEASNKKIKQLLEEKQKWMTSTAQSNKKLGALEKLCRRLKSENDRLQPPPVAAAQVESGCDELNKHSK